MTSDCEWPVPTLEPCCDPPNWSVINFNNVKYVRADLDGVPPKELCLLAQQMAKWSVYGPWIDCADGKSWYREAITGACNAECWISSDGHWYASIMGTSRVLDYGSPRERICGRDASPAAKARVDALLALVPNTVLMEE